MTGRLFSRQWLLAASLGCAIFGLTPLTNRPDFLFKTPGHPSWNQVPEGSVHLVSFRQDARPSFDGGVGWINSGPIDLAQLKGKVVLLDFWTYCCINCHHILPDLAKLEAKYRNELVVIGVHSAKFDAERDTENIRRKVAEYRIKHPVVNDANMVIWQRFGVNSWPTLVVIDPAGNYVGSVSGEGHYALLDQVIGKLTQEYKGQLNLKPLMLEPEKDRAPATPLLFPGKILADRAGGRLFITDTGHNRIVLTDLGGKPSMVIGDGGEGLVDGPIADARFNRPQGLYLEKDILYVADTENHAIRAVDLKAKKVTTVAGIGTQSHRSRAEMFVGPARTSALSSPWDLISLPGSSVLYIAMAGPHQIWRYNPKNGQISSWAGSGFENIRDGDLESASFAQPSGLATDGENLFVADSEVSGVRIISGVKTGKPEVGRIVGMGLFEFGDRDGVGPEVRLQHCLGVAYGGGKLYIADTYNNKIKVADPKTREVKTFAGTGDPGDENDPPRFYQPGGLSVSGTDLYVADTNNHRIRVIDLKTGKVRTLLTEGLKPPQAR
jgi:thiol-disulfide isomerase/thioredoxin